MTEQEPMVIGEYVVGDVINAVLELRTPVNIRGFGVVFQKEDDPAIRFELAPEVPGRGRSTRLQKTALSGVVGLDIPPGLYFLDHVYFITRAGRTFRIQDEEIKDLRAYAIRILPEPEQRPQILTFDLR